MSERYEIEVREKRPRADRYDGSRWRLQNGCLRTIIGVLGLCFVSQTGACPVPLHLYLGVKRSDVICLQRNLTGSTGFSDDAVGSYESVSDIAPSRWQRSDGTTIAVDDYGSLVLKSTLFNFAQIAVDRSHSTAPAIHANTEGQSDEINPLIRAGGIRVSASPFDTTGGGDVATIAYTDTLDSSSSDLSSSITNAPEPNAQPVRALAVPQSTPSPNDWDTLCGQAGIFVCDNFSDRHTGDIIEVTTKPYMRDGTLVLTIPSKSGPAAAGEYHHRNFDPIGEGEFIAFSYRIKADAPALSIPNPGRKEFILWRGSSSCTDLQLAQTHNGSGPVVVPYTACGQRSFALKIPNSSGNYQWHYPDYDCQYHAVKRGEISGCAISHPDQWENYYVEVEVGDYGQPNSRVTMWHREDSSEWKRYVDTSTYRFKGTGGFNNFMLTAYMTGKDETIDHAEGRIYYDHLIISTKPFDVDQFLAATINPIGASRSTPDPAEDSAPDPNTATDETVDKFPDASADQAKLERLVRTVETIVPPLTAPSSKPAPSLASQVAAIPPGQWAKITADNKAIDIDPDRRPESNSRFPNNAPYHGVEGFKAVWTNWNSGGYAENLGPCGSMIYYGGGHNGYFGNGVTSLDLCGGVAGGPVWRQLSNPYNETIKWPATHGVFPDGTPSPAHTYDAVVVADNKLMVFNAQTTNVPNNIDSSFIFDLTDRTWTGPLSQGNTSGASAWDSKRKLAWNVPSYTARDTRLSSFNPQTRLFENYYKTNRTQFISNVDSMMDYDPDNDKLLLSWFRGPNPESLTEIDPANPNAKPIIVKQIGKPAHPSGQHAFSWSKKRNAFIVWMDMNRNANVYEIKRTGVGRDGIPEYTWNLLTSSANTIVPIAVSHTGSFDKFRTVSMGNDEVLIGQLRPRDGIFAFKIPSASRQHQ